jgi:hypothetical protein
MESKARLTQGEDVIFQALLKHGDWRIQEVPDGKFPKGFRSEKLEYRLLRTDGFKWFTPDGKESIFGLMALGLLEMEANGIYKLSEKQKKFGLRHSLSLQINRSLDVTWH